MSLFHKQVMKLISEAIGLYMYKGYPPNSVSKLDFWQVVTQMLQATLFVKDVTVLLTLKHQLYVS